MHKIISKLYGRFNTYLFYALILIGTYLVILFYFPGDFQTCVPHSLPLYRSEYFGMLITFLTLCMGVSSIGYILVGVIGYVFSLIRKSKFEQIKKKKYIYMIFKGFVGIVTAFIFFLLISLVLSFMPISLCPRMLPNLPTN